MQMISVIPPAQNKLLSQALLSHLHLWSECEADHRSQKDPFHEYSTIGEWKGGTSLVARFGHSWKGSIQRIVAQFASGEVWWQPNRNIRDGPSQKCVLKCFHMNWLLCIQWTIPDNWEQAGRNCRYWQKNSTQGFECAHTILKGMDRCE